ncbi:unnamed protein product [Caenorhabditis brenneri]
MSLFRPVQFPFLKLPYLCIESVIRSWDIFDIIFFALLSRKTRRIVKSLKIPLNGIEVYLKSYKRISLRRDHKILNSWDFIHGNTEGIPLVLQKNADPLYTVKSNLSLDSYTAGNEADALKMALEFLNDVFKCTVDTIEIEGDNFPESGDLAVRSTVNLDLSWQELQEFGPVRSQHLNLLLQNLEVTDMFNFYVENPGYLDPKLFKCQELWFWSYPPVWLTRDVLLQFEAPRLTFYSLPLEIIVSFVTHWFYSDNKKLEYLYIDNRELVEEEELPQTQIPLEAFKDLKPVHFSERSKVPKLESITDMDFSKGLEIIRHDGLQATIHSSGDEFLFYVWH